jgi:hypothetical protein
MSVTRVHYRERQPLRATDLHQEQSYHLAMRRRHHIAHHGWGIVAGLRVAADEADGFVVEPGMAIDGYGRELIVPEPYQLPLGCFDVLACDTIDMWLVYRRLAETPPQRGRWDCGPGRHSRWREEAYVRLVPADTIDPCQPVDTSATDCACGAQEVSLDDSEREWPVYLGRIGQPLPEDPPPRHYVALTGETITAPSGRARVQVGSGTSGDRQFFAVRLPDENGAFIDRFTIDRDGHATIHGETTLDGDLIVGSLTLRTDDLNDPARLARTLRDAQDPLSQYLRGTFSQETLDQLSGYRGVCPPSGMLQEVLVTALNTALEDLTLYDAQRFAHVRLREETEALRKMIQRNPQTQNRQLLQRLFNRLLLEDGYPEVIAPMGVTPSVEFRPMETPPEAAAPWQIYHTIVSQNDTLIHQLRLELGHPGDTGNPSLYKLVIGHAGINGFVPCLTVAADCTVTIHDNLTIMGQLVQGPIQADPDDSRFADALLDQWLQGIATAGATLDSLRLELTAPEEVSAGGPLNYTITVRNIGTRPVTPVQLRGSLTVRMQGQTVDQQEIRHDLATLDPGREDIVTTYDVTAEGGDITIAVTALGIGPAGNIVSASASKMVQIITSSEP